MLRNGKRDFPHFCCSFKFDNKKKHFICTLREWVDLAFCECKVVNLGNDTVKILAAYFTYSMLFVDSKNFVETTSKVEEMLSMKILYISSMKTVPKFITEKLEKNLKIE